MVDKPTRKRPRHPWITATLNIVVGLLVLALLAYLTFSPNAPKTLRLSSTEATFATAAAVALIGSASMRLVLLRRQRLAANHAFGTIRIVAAPAGEAPLWVREKWVGVELPLARKPDRTKNSFTTGVMSGPKNCMSGLVGLLTGRYKRQRGFVVPVMDALQQLEAASPEAAEWWRTNTPHLCKPWQRFMFESEACEVIV